MHVVSLWSARNASCQASAETAPRAATAASCPACPAALQGERVLTAMKYDPHSGTEIRSRLRLRSTVPGANNRLDIRAIVSWDRADGQAVNMMGARWARWARWARCAG